MLGIVVVPRNAIIIQKCEKFVSISDKTFLAFQSRFALVVSSFELSIESFDARHMLFQEMFLQSVSIDGFHHGFEQFRESRDDLFQLIVERIGKNFVVQISHEVNEASLLWTSQGVVCGVEIRDHDALEPSK